MRSSCVSFHVISFFLREFERTGNPSPSSRITGVIYQIKPEEARKCMEIKGVRKMDLLFETHGWTITLSTHHRRHVVPAVTVSSEDKLALSDFLGSGF